MVQNPKQRKFGELGRREEKNSHSTENPTISIITVVFNDAQQLAATINSVVEQDYPNIEYIIVDGGSTDGTIDILKQYENNIDYWVSELDKGIYDAMNKATKLAQGSWINFMNSGDQFINNQVVSSVFSKNIDAELIYGDHEIRYATIKKCVKAKSILELYKGMIFCHQSMFISRAYQLANPYQYSDYSLAADYKLVFDYLTGDRYNVFYTDHVIASVQAKGASNENIVTTIKEYRSIALSRSRAFEIRFFYFFRFIDVTIRMFIKRILPEYAIDFVRKQF